MDLRFVCLDCGVKWFVPAGVPAPTDLLRCGACDGELAPLEPVRGDPPPVWDPGADN